MLGCGIPNDRTFVVLSAFSQIAVEGCENCSCSRQKPSVKVDYTEISSQLDDVRRFRLLSDRFDLGRRWFDSVARDLVRQEFYLVNTKYAFDWVDL